MTLTGVVDRASFAGGALLKLSGVDRQVKKVLPIDQIDVTTEYFRVINEVATGNVEPAAAADAMATFISNRS